MISTPFIRTTNPYEGESERVSTGNACHDPAGKGCNSSDGVEIHLHESGVLTGYCWPCQTWYSPEEVDKVEGVDKGELSADIITHQQSDRYVESRLKAIESYPICKAGFRGIDLRTCVYANLRMSGSIHFGSMDSVFYEYWSREDIEEGILSMRTGWKNRIIPKTMFTVGTSKGSKLYLQRQAELLPNRGYLIITEGEHDALAVLMSLRIHTGKWCRVVSLPTGGNIKGLINNEEFVESHKKLLLWTDNDKVGLKNLDQTVEYFGEKVVPIISPAGKDANALLLDEGSEVVYTVIKEALR